MKYRQRIIMSLWHGLKSKVNRKKVHCDWRNSLFEKNVTLDCRDGGEITAGRLTLESHTYFAASGLLSIGEKVFFNRNCIVVCRESISIGDNCIFGPNVCIYDHDHIFNRTGIQPGFKTKPVCIGKNCWIGAGSIILKGAEIGDNCVIGAGTVVTGKIPSGSLVKGNRENIIIPIKD